MHAVSFSVRFALRQPHYADCGKVANNKTCLKLGKALQYADDREVDGADLLRAFPVCCENNIEACICNRRWIFTCKINWVLTAWVGRVCQPVLRLATGWTVRGSNPGGTRNSTRPDRPWGPPSPLYNGYRVSSGGKVWPGRAADHSPPSSGAVMEE